MVTEKAMELGQALIESAEYLQYQEAKEALEADVEASALLSDYTELGEGVSLFTDSPRFRCGNLYENYADNAEVHTAVDGGKASCSKKVRITFSGMLIEWSDQFGSSFSHGTIKNIEVIE